MNKITEKIFIDPGILPKKELIEIINNSEKDITIITQNSLSDYLCLDKKIQITNYPKKYKIKSNQVYKTSPDQVWNKLIDDHQTLMLYDRELTLPKQTNYKIYEIIKLSMAFQAFLENSRPSKVIFGSAPHHIDTWIFARVAEILNIEILYCKESIFPWRYYLCQGLNATSKVIKPANNIPEDDEKLLISEFLKQKKGSKLDALPIYEKERLEKNHGKHFNLKNELTTWWHRPELIINKAMCYLKYKKVTRNFNLPENYIVFFLHYQPERTTLPEGYGFAQQLAAIEILSMALPSNHFLIVKEHPSIFTSMCSWKERSPEYYVKIQEIPNVIISPLEVDAYYLIDNCKAVATITGTTSGEAVIRGKPAIIFGNGTIKNTTYEFIHQYHDLPGLQDFLEKSDGIEKNSNNDDKFINDILGSTFSSSKNEIQELLINLHTPSIRYNVLLTAIRQIFS